MKYLYCPKIKGVLIGARKSRVVNYLIFQVRKNYKREKYKRALFNGNKVIIESKYVSNEVKLPRKFFYYKLIHLHLMYILF